MLVGKLDDKILDGCYSCNKVVANFLIHKMGFPLLHIKEGKYYFFETEELRESLKKLPAWLKLFKFLP